MGELRGIHKDRLKLRFLKPEGKISRRDLLKLVLPRYEVIPFIKPNLCRGSQECGLCLDACPLEAIKVEAGEVNIDTTLCSGCGACIAACPHRAIDYPSFTPEQLDEGMERLLLSEGAIHEPGIIALVCKNCVTVPGEDRASQPILPSGVLSLDIPCLAMASPWLMLRAFDRGAQGLALMAGRKCSAGFNPAGWQGNIRFVQGLLGCWGIEPERIRTFDITGASDSVIRELEQFARAIAGSGPAVLGISEPTSVPGDGLLLPALVKGLKKKLGGSPKEVVIAGMVPFGKLELDGSQCSGCGLCARDCPTEALTALSIGETDAYQLLFHHELCVACNRCIEVCPEKCLRLERILELDKIGSPATVLFEDRIARCRECGSIIGTRAVIDGLRIKLMAAGDSFTSQLELCPVCKIGAHYGHIA